MCATVLYAIWGAACSLASHCRSSLPHLPALPHLLSRNRPLSFHRAAVADRVAVERGESCGENVGYTIRLDSKGGPASSLMFATNGVLLRMLTGAGREPLANVTHLVGVCGGRFVAELVLFCAFAEVGWRMGFEPPAPALWSRRLCTLSAPAARSFPRCACRSWMRFTSATDLQTSFSSW
jgi:hypothetical protein